MPSDLTPEVRRLMSENKGDRVIAETLEITRHQARNLMREVELADAKQGASAAAPESFAETLRQDPEAWAIRINARWRQSRENIIETGRLLLDAKAACLHGTFENEVVTRLHFSPNVAQRLMAIARDPRLSNPAHVQLLPPSWGTLYELTKLSDEEFDRGVQEQIIRPDMERKEVEILRPTPRRDREEPSSDGGVESKAGGPDRSPLEHASGTVVEGGQVTTTGKDALAGFAQADKSAQPTAGDGRIPDQPETAYSSDRQIAGVAPGPSEIPSMPGGGLAIAHNRIEPSESLDFFPTPPWATRALIERVFVHLERRNHCQFQVCWEPACGEGHMAEPLKEYFREVVASDVKYYGYGDHTVDFLTCEQLARKYDADWIITNPPFGENTDKFILKALSLAGTGVAMLVRLQCLETVGRYEKIFKNRPPTLIAFFVERVPMHKGRWEPQGDTMTAYIWLVWLKGAAPQAPFWIPPGCREALTKPDDAERFGVKAESNETPTSEAAE